MQIKDMKHDLHGMTAINNLLSLCYSSLFIFEAGLGFLVLVWGEFVCLLFPFGLFSLG